MRHELTTLEDRPPIHFYTTVLPLPQQGRIQACLLGRDSYPSIGLLQVCLQETSAPFSASSDTPSSDTCAEILDAYPMPSYAVIGASRGIGLELVRQLVSH